LTSLNGRVREVESRLEDLVAEDAVVKKLRSFKPVLFTIHWH
jgi:hypothetical protein